MYYLDLHQLYKPTTKESRVIVRRKLNRDKMMTVRLKLQHNLCFYCGTEVDNTAHLDHVIPVYYGGDNSPVNLVASCRSCNITKMTDQIEITNPYTIKDYLAKCAAYHKWLTKYNNAGPNKRKLLKQYMPVIVRLYKVYRADLFKKI